jgi:predicted nucleic acid-binding protein
VKVFLDACCLSRLTDDQSQARIREEAEAIERILAGVRQGTVELASSEALEDEARRTPSMERRIELEILLSVASITVEVGEAIATTLPRMARAGYGVFDALHLAAAESAGVDVLLSTDDRLIKRVARGVGNPRIAVRNPVSWSKDYDRN